MSLKNLKIVFLQLFLYVSLCLAYNAVIADQFSYMGFISEFNSTKFFVGTTILLLSLLCSFFISYGFVWAVWHFIFSLFYIPEIIMYQFDNTIYVQLLSLSTVLFLLILVSKFNVHFSEISKFRDPDKIMSILSILMFLPFLILYIKYVNPKNLLLVDVYQTRSLFRSIGHTFTGYLNAPLVRVLLPILIVHKLENKQYKSFFLYLCMVLYVYLCGALKSVFMGLLALLIFYRGTFYKKCKIFLSSISVLALLGTIVAKFTNNVFLLDIFIRRVFFVPPSLNDAYNRYFTNNFTYFSQTGLPFLETKNYDSLSMYVGEQVLGKPGFNANVGVFTEGYISAGVLGILIMSLFIACIVAFINICDIDPKYFGIVFVYIYYFNTAFSTTLLITHGLFFFLIVCFFFLRKGPEYSIDKTYT